MISIHTFLRLLEFAGNVVILYEQVSAFFTSLNDEETLDTIVVDPLPVQTVDNTTTEVVSSTNNNRLLYHILDFVSKIFDQYRVQGKLGYGFVDYIAQKERIPAEWVRTFIDCTKTYADVRITSKELRGSIFADMLNSFTADIRASGIAGKSILTISSEEGVPEFLVREVLHPKTMVFDAYWSDRENHRLSPKDSMLDIFGKRLVKGIPTLMLIEKKESLAYHFIIWSEILPWKFRRIIGPNRLLAFGEALLQQWFSDIVSDYRIDTSMRVIELSSSEELAETLAYVLDTQDEFVVTSTSLIDESMSDNY